MLESGLRGHTAEHHSAWIDALDQRVEHGALGGGGMAGVASRVRQGTVLVHERTLSHEDVAAFGHLTGDRGAQHVGDSPIAQGLLVAAVPTKIGGDLSFLGAVMRLEFLRPVMAGQRVRAELCVEELVRASRGWNALLASTVFDAAGAVAVRGEVEGRLSESVVDEEPLLPAFRARARLGAAASWIDVVNAVAAIPYGRTDARSPAGTLARWRGTCSTKHSLLRALLAEGWPELRIETRHRVHRVTPSLAAELYGERAAAAVPETGLTDVHTYLTVATGQKRIRVDVTLAAEGAWTGQADMRLWCGEGFDVAGGRFPARGKKELVARFCDPTAREPFVAALAGQ